MKTGQQNSLSVSLLLVVVLLLLGAQAALAKGTPGVANTMHNLSTSAPDIMPLANPYRSQNEDQICVFCHTPHGGDTRGPLWNKPFPTHGTWTHYNSVTLSSFVNTDGVDRPPSDESMLCLSCHDGSISPYAMLNISNDVLADPYGQPVTESFDGDGTGGFPKIEIVGLPGESARIGATELDAGAVGDLSDDHPISFSYQAVYDDFVNNGRAGLKAPATAVTNGVRFFGGTALNVECSSCHDPHVDYTLAGQEVYQAFLITPNTGSALCLACHTK